MSEPLLIIYLDRYHLGDAMFLQALGRSMARLSRARRPAIVLHGPGEHVERALEAEGIFVDGGIDAMNSAEARSTALLAIHDLNQRLCGMFTEAMAPAVPVRAADRRLFERGLPVSEARMRWVSQLAAMPALPVIAGTVAADEDSIIGDPISLLGQLVEAGADKNLPVLFTRTNLPGLMDGANIIDEILADDDRIESVLGGREVLESLMLVCEECLVTNAAKLGSREGKEGTLVRFKP